MKSFPPGIMFKFPWRSYQARVLTELEHHLDDNCLNVVAAPGSGKTVLGLEVILRLNKPTLVLAPSIAIRNQWISRFLDSFLQTEDQPHWISSDVKKPALLTVATYQGLHAAFTGKMEEEEKEPGDEAEAENDVLNDDSQSYSPLAEPGTNETLEALKKCGIKTIVVDEAHHLRNEWWKSLTILKDYITDPTIVALTATPPYDVSAFEWERYQTLCGPIDAEISVPELVLARNLCPHQDYVILNTLSPDDARLVFTFRQNADVFMNALVRDERFNEALQNHPCIKDPGLFIEKILEKPGYFSSMVLFLNRCGVSINKDFLKIMGIARRKIPPFDLEWADILLGHFLYEDTYIYENYKDLVLELRKQLHGIGAIVNKKVMLQKNPRLDKILRNSPNKLHSIGDIVELEYNHLQQDLRLVILTDYVRKELLPGPGEELKGIACMGVVPIFEKIRRDCTAGIKLGILCGSLVIIPAAAGKTLEEMAVKCRIPLANLKVSPLAHDKNFLLVAIRGESNQKIVQLLTGVFSQGEIQVLVGTKSLLGEGWDAPFVNSLILASFVGSYMFSNQMRGRAIRTHAPEPGKTANIWHIITVQTGNPYAGDEFELLERRFKAFVGLSGAGERIENGFERLDSGRPPFSEKDIAGFNERAKQKALLRKQLGEDWQKVLASGQVKQIIPEIKSPRKALPRNFVFFNTVYALLWRSMLGGIHLFFGALRLFRFMIRFDNLSGAAYIISNIALAVLVFSLPGLFKPIYLFFKHGSIAGSMSQLGTAIFKTLCKMDLIKTVPDKLRVVTAKGKNGSVICRLEGGTPYEQSLFLDSLEEVLNPIENPRYLIIRKSKLKSLSRLDFHAVPEIMGMKRKNADYFSRMWSKYMGSNKLVYTRNLEGRKFLLYARQKSFSAGTQKRTERLSTWK
ncbi:MAG TPA: DEAD/DEAH box helicase family protein [Candidatus Deferrimicrobium sp.]|nr:DEAD/DEAH box helicase family protein [Candidatus Deferrimicrobium sp.]